MNKPGTRNTFYSKCSPGVGRIYMTVITCILRLCWHLCYNTCRDMSPIHPLKLKIKTTLYLLHKKKKKTCDTAYTFGPLLILFPSVKQTKQTKKKKETV